MRESMDFFKVSRVVKILIYKVIYNKKIVFKGIPDFGKKQNQFNIIKGKINIGKHCSFKKSAYFAVVNGGVLNIGNKVSFNRNCIVVCHNEITIEDGCAIGPNTLIYDHNHRFGVNGIEDGFNSMPVKIGKNCWIGANVIILKGTCIGEGSVIGAGTIVSGVIPSHSLVTSSREIQISAIE